MKDLIWRLIRRGQAQNLRPGIFADCSFDNPKSSEKYQLPEEVLLSIVRDAGGEIVLEAVVVAIRDMNIVIKPRTVYNRLSKLVQRQVIERTESGYRLPVRIPEVMVENQQRSGQYL